MLNLNYWALSSEHEQKIIELRSLYNLCFARTVYF